MNTNIFLKEFDSKKSVSSNSGLNVSLGGKRKLLPLTDASYVISAYEQYEKERKNCNTIRLTCQINPICTNVLFNRITEIVKYEGSSGVTVLNYGIGKDEEFDGVKYKEKTMKFWSGNCATYQSVDGITSTLSYQTQVPKAVEMSSKNYDSTELFEDKDSLHPTNAIRDMQLSRKIEGDKDDDYFVFQISLRN